MQASRFTYGEKRDGFTLTIRAVGFNGIAAITWAVACPKRINAKSNVGRQCAAMSSKFDAIANLGIFSAADDSGRPYSIGLMTAETSDGVESGVEDRLIDQQRPFDDG